MPLFESGHVVGIKAGQQLGLGLAAPIKQLSRFNAGCQGRRSGQESRPSVKRLGKRRDNLTNNDLAALIQQPLGWHPRWNRGSSVAGALDCGCQISTARSSRNSNQPSRAPLAMYSAIFWHRALPPRCCSGRCRLLWGSWGSAGHRPPVQAPRGDWPRTPGQIAREKASDRGAAAGLGRSTSPRMQ